MTEIERLKSELGTELQKPKAKNLKENDVRIARNPEEVKSLIKQINEEKAKIKSSIEEKHKTARKKEVETNTSRRSFSIERGKRLSGIAKKRRQKKNK